MLSLTSNSIDTFSCRNSVSRRQKRATRSSYDLFSSPLLLLSERTHVRVHAFVICMCVFFEFFVFFCVVVADFVVLLWRSDAVVIINTGEKLYFFSSADSVSMVSHMHTHTQNVYEHTKPWNFLFSFT